MRPGRFAAVLGAAVAALAMCIPFAAGATAVAATGSSTPPDAPAPTSTGEASPAAAVAVSWALARVGTPYRWGGTGPGGFDCSGLVQAAYGAGGIALPRVAQDQFDAGPAAPSGALLPGDLVFFGTGPAGIDHVGIALGDGLMVDAPHTGAVVRVESIWPDGYVSATRPAP